MPSFGRNLSSEFRCRHIAQRTCAWESLREKYQWPEAGAAKFEISPSSHSSGMPDSSSRRTSLLRRDTEYMSRSMAGPAALPGVGGGSKLKLTAGLSDEGEVRTIPHRSLPLNTPMRILEEALTFDDVLLVPAY